MESFLRKVVCVNKTVNQKKSNKCYTNADMKIYRYLRLHTKIV